MKKFFLGVLLCGVFCFGAIAVPRFEADVSVDIIAKSVKEAKAKAMAKAQRDALGEVLLTISTSKSVDEINKLTDKQLEHFISSVMVLMEKTSDVRYIADLRVSVNENVLRAYMAENGMPLVIGEERDVLIIPLFEKEDGTPELWGDENVWRKAFLEHKNLQKGNLNIRCIDKNLGNIAAIKTNRVFDMEQKEYEDLLDFNQATEIYVLKYSLKEGKVYVKELLNGEMKEVLVAGLSIDEAIDEVLPLFKDIRREKMAAEMENISENSVKEEQIEAVYGYPRLGLWMSLKKILENNPYVRDIQVVSMANGKVHFNFKFSGVLEKLQINLEMQGYKMRKEGDHYVVY